MLRQFYFFICFHLFSQAKARDLPPYFPRCHIDDSNLSECLVNATRTLKPLIINGVKEIELPPIDPLVTTFHINQDSSVLKYNSSFINFTARGFSSYEFDELTYNPQSLELNGKVRFENILTSFTYKLYGRFLYFPVNGEGTGEIDFGSVNGTFNVKGKLVKRKGVEYYRPTSTKAKIQIVGIFAFLNGLFDQNSELGHLTNELLNINGQEIADGSTPVAEIMVERLLKKFVGTLTKLVPYNKLFPSS